MSLDAAQGISVLNRNDEIPLGYAQGRLCSLRALRMTWARYGYEDARIDWWRFASGHWHG